MGEMLKSTMTEPKPVFVARATFVGELQALTKQHPQVGFGVSLQTHKGERYMLANANMPRPKHNEDSFPKGRRIAFLENGSRFKAIEVLADTSEVEPSDVHAEAALLRDVMKLIAEIETPTRLPVGRLSLKTEKCV